MTTLKKYILIFLITPLLFLQCDDDDYEVDYDEDQISFYYQQEKIIYKNNLEYPVILDSILVNDIEVKTYITNKVCDYTKYKDEVVVNYTGDLNEVITLTTIILPGQKIEFPYKLNPEDEVIIEFYPVNFNFLADNVYFEKRKFSDQEFRYRLYPNNDIRNLNIDKFRQENKIPAIDGIMIYVKEYQAMEDFLEEVDFELEETGK